MLKNPASFVLGSPKSSTGTRPPHQLGGAHRRGAPYSSHRAPLRVRLRFRFACSLAGRTFWASWGTVRLPCHTCGPLQFSPTKIVNPRTV